MVQRLITAIVGLIILGVVFFVGGSKVVAIASLLIALIAMKELYSSYDKTKAAIDKPYRFFGFTFACLLYLLQLTFNRNLTTIILISFAFIVISYGMLTYNDKTLSNIATTILSMIYIPCSFWLIFLMFNDKSMNMFVGYIFIIAFGSDSFAYFSGVLLGKKKITPILSPNKTLGGFIGGALGCLILVFVYTFLLSFFITSINFSIISIIKYSIFALAGAFVSQIGDLLASAIKRTNGIKDYSNLMPGHGGILDRFDSVLLVTPYVYIVVTFLFI